MIGKREVCSAAQHSHLTFCLKLDALPIAASATRDWTLGAKLSQIRRRKLGCA